MSDKFKVLYYVNQFFGGCFSAVLAAAQKQNRDYVQ
jgi:hypothetical protein